VIIESGSMYGKVGLNALKRAISFLGLKFSLILHEFNELYLLMTKNSFG
jgi:hypothetical protein